jgi:hypothetical protein
MLRSQSTELEEDQSQNVCDSGRLKVGRRGRERDRHARAGVNDTLQLALGCIHSIRARNAMPDFAFKENCRARAPRTLELELGGGPECTSGPGFGGRWSSVDLCNPADGSGLDGEVGGGQSP